MIGSARRLEARPGPAAAWPVLLGRAAVCAGGRALLWSLRHYANPSNNERPGPQPHKQTLNNVRTRPVVQCLPMGRCAYPRLGLLVWALHPIRRHYTPSVRVQRHVTGAAPPIMCMTLATAVGMPPCETADSDRSRPALEPPTSAVPMRGSMLGMALITQSPRLSVALSPHNPARTPDRSSNQRCADHFHVESIHVSPEQSQHHSCQACRSHRTRK